MTNSDFWRAGVELPNMIRWISRGHYNFIRACDTVHFERGTKQRYRLGPIDEAKLAEGLSAFHESAPILDEHLHKREWLLASGISYADFRMATFLPVNNVASLPLPSYPALTAWYRRLEALSAWSEPFLGLQADDLPPIS